MQLLFGKEVLLAVFGCWFRHERRIALVGTLNAGFHVSSIWISRGELDGNSIWRTVLNIFVVGRCTRREIIWYELHLKDTKHAYCWETVESCIIACKHVVLTVFGVPLWWSEKDRYDYDVEWENWCVLDTTRDDPIEIGFGGSKYAYC